MLTWYYVICAAIKNLNWKQNAIKETGIWNKKKRKKERWYELWKGLEKREIDGIQNGGRRNKTKKKVLKVKGWKYS